MTDQPTVSPEEREKQEKFEAFFEALVDQIQWDIMGLVPAVVQDVETGLILMVAYMNPEALRLTLEKHETYFWSRSREELWHKGETSGNTQKLVGIYVDCDADSLLVKVWPTGPSCHTGEFSCFYRPLEELVEDSE